MIPGDCFHQQCCGFWLLLCHVEISAPLVKARRANPPSLLALKCKSLLTTIYEMSKAMQTLLLHRFFEHILCFRVWPLQCAYCKLNWQNWRLENINNFFILPLIALHATHVLCIGCSAYHSLQLSGYLQTRFNIAIRKSILKLLKTNLYIIHKTKGRDVDVSRKNSTMQKHGPERSHFAN